MKKEESKLYRKRGLTKGYIDYLKVAVLIHDKQGLAINEVACQLSLSYKATHRHLRKLRERGKLFVSIKNDNKHRYYPISEEAKFFDSARDLLRKLDEFDSSFGGKDNI